MRNITLEKLLAGDPVMAPRAAHDMYFPLVAGSFDYRGEMDRAARFIERYQLLDAERWAKFVNVFTETPKPDSANHGWRGEYWGKMMRGACITYMYTQNKQLYKIVTDSVRDMLGAAEEDGRISAYDREAEFTGWDIWARKYVMLAMEYYLQICEDKAFAAEVLRCISREADYLLAHVGTGEGQIPITKTSEWWGGVNSSSVLEPIVRLYDLTGEKKYLDFATYIIEEGGSAMENIFENALEDKKAPYEYAVVKAYETISCFEGLVEYYRVTSEEKWRTAAVNFGRAIMKYEISIIGSCGCWHELFDYAAVWQVSTENTGLMQETCVTVTWMKFCLQMLCLTGDPAYADAIERSAYNAMLGAVNFGKHQNFGGMPFDSYSPLLMQTRARYIGGKQVLSDGTFYGCCACIGSAGTGIIPLSSALFSEDGVAIALYLPGTIAATTPAGKPLEIEIKTDYPADGAVSLTFDTTDDAPFTVAFRIPAWSKRTQMAVNAQLTDAPAGTFVKIERVWHCGDRVELFFDMRTEVLHPQEPYPDENARYHVALRRGPLVLARDLRLGDDFNAPVDLAEDAEGYATVEPDERPDFARCAFRVKKKDGGYIRTVDYASAGSTWDCESLMSAWLPTKEYHPFDIDKPFTLQVSAHTRLVPGETRCINFYSKADTAMRGKYFSAPTDDGERTVFRAAERNGNSLFFETEGGRLTVDADGNVVLTPHGTRFTLVPDGQNRYAIKAPDGRLLYPTRHAECIPICARESEVTPYTIFDFLN